MDQHVMKSPHFDLHLGTLQSLTIQNTFESLMQLHLLNDILWYVQTLSLQATKQLQISH